MLHQTITTEGGRATARAVATNGYPTLAMKLVAKMRRSLDEDPALVRHYLERLAALLHSEPKLCEREQGLIPASVIHRPTLNKGRLASWQERRVVEYIDANLASSILADDLASVVGLSSGHFTRAFKATTGETPHVFIVRQRIRRAQLLMLETKESLAQIACACGLADQAHLARLFRSVVGITPTAWRRRWQRPLQQ